MTNKERETLDFHARALSCFCACLSYHQANAERLRDGLPLMYPDSDFWSEMQRWKLVDENNNPHVQHEPDWRAT